MHKLIAGVDLGGTNVRIALASQEAPETFLVHRTSRTPVAGGPQAFLDVVKSGIGMCLEELGHGHEALAGIGCTIPGITDARAGKALLVTNLPGWDGFHIEEALTQALGVPAAVDNDVNAAALGEYWFGQGKGCSSVVYLTISTGVAAGIVVQGHLLRGFNHAAGEMGFFVPDPAHLAGNWEPNGCLELTSAGVGIAQRWRAATNAGEEHSAADVFNAAESGDAEAQRIVTQAADYLGLATLAIATVIDPERIVLSGSIVQHQQFVYDRICTIVDKHLPHAPSIVPSVFDGDAPLIGALALIAKKKNE